MYIVCGEVEAKVWYTESKKIYYNQEILTDTGEEEKKYQIKINKTLSKFEIYDTIYTEQKIKLFSNFYLPISVVKITNKEQIKEEKNYTLEEAISLGKQELAESIEQQIENKDKITRKSYKYI